MKERRAAIWLVIAFALTTYVTRVGGGCACGVYSHSGRTKFTTSGAHDVIAITSPLKNDLCTEELRDRAKTQVTGGGQSTT